MEQLRRLRTEKGLSQAKMAALADLDPSTVNQIETGARKPTTATLEKLAAALDVEIAELFRGYEIPPKSPGAVVKILKEALEAENNDRDTEIR